MASKGLEYGTSPCNPILLRWYDGRMLSARIGSKEAGMLLGYIPIHIRYLIDANHLKPLGKTPKQKDDHKWKFSSKYIVALMEDEKWLHEAEQIIWKRTEEAEENKTKTKPKEKKSSTITKLAA